jgi:hypothetical protein
LPQSALRGGCTLRPQKILDLSDSLTMSPAMARCVRWTSRSQRWGNYKTDEHLAGDQCSDCQNRDQISIHHSFSG